jgi:asparagine synthase (glutamine-hydrolysing)
MYDCLRANKSFRLGVSKDAILDKEFMDVAMRDPQDKMINKEHPMEKWVVRKAFEDMLPESIVWRQKSSLAMVLVTVD